MGVENYVLGRGVVSIGAWSGTSYPGSLTSIGNCPEVSITLEEETLEHFSSQSGIQVKDKVATLSMGYTINIQTDEWTDANLARFFRGTVNAATASDDAYIDILSATDTEYAVKFVSANPVGPNIVLYCWRVKLTPGGDLGLISQEWGVMTYEGEGLKVSALGAAGADPTSYYGKIEMAGTATG